MYDLLFCLFSEKDRPCHDSTLLDIVWTVDLYDLMIVKMEMEFHISIPIGVVLL